MKEIEVWYVSGDDTDFGRPQLWMYKIEAEAYARELYPDEDESSRYARIFYRRVFSTQGESK